MPSIEINISVYEPGQGYSEKNFRRSFIISGNKSKKRITSQDLKDIVENLKILLANYNKGERGNSWNYTPIRIEDDNKTQK